jgi:hypothetical protein
MDMPYSVPLGTFTQVLLLGSQAIPPDENLRLKT